MLRLVLTPATLQQTSAAALQDPRLGPGSIALTRPSARGLHRLDRMAGITNRPKDAEEEGQRRVEQRKDELTDIENVNRPRKDHPVDKDRKHDIASRDRISETGVGLGP